jgi:concanavalin A-like lectin/glucanase superfamily protein
VFLHTNISGGNCPQYEDLFPFKKILKMKEKIKKHLKKRKKIYSFLVGILMLIATLFGATAALEDGRIVNMPFNQTIEDISPYNESWSYLIGNSTTYTNDSIEGHSANFTDNVINLNDLEYYGTNTSTAFTFNFYVKMKDVPTDSTSYYFNYVASNNFQSYISYRGSDNRILAQTYAAGWRDISYYGATGLNEWNMITYSWTGSTYRLYFNNVSVASYSSSTAITPSSGKHYINGNYNGAIRLNALFDDYMVWNRALTTDEISELYARIPPPPPYPTNVTGDGSVGDPFLINDCRDLQDLTYIMDPGTYEYIELNNTIDCAQYLSFEPIANNSIFYGEFQGNGYTIKNIQNDLDMQKGLFYKIEGPSKIQNFTLQNVTFENGSYQGCVFGEISDLTFGTTTFNYINVTDCTITGATYLGGLGGYTRSYTTTGQHWYFENINFENLQIQATGGKVGGLIGNHYSDTATVTDRTDYFRNITIQGNITGTETETGGLLGIKQGDIRDRTYMSNIILDIDGIHAGLFGHLDQNHEDLRLDDIRITGNFLGHGLMTSCFQNLGGVWDDIIIYNEANSSYQALSGTWTSCTPTITDIFYNNDSYQESQGLIQGLSYNDLRLDLPIFENLTDWDINRCQEHTLTFENYVYPGLGTFAISEPTNTETINYFEGESAIVNITLNPTGLMCDCDINIDDTLESYSFENFQTYSYITAIEDTYNLDVVCAQGNVNQSITFNTHEIREYLNIITPDHNQRTNHSDNDVIFNLNTTEPGAFTCRGYVNGSQQFTNSYLGNINHTEALVFPLGIANYTVQCDGVGGILQSQILLYDFDNATPFIESFGISTFGDSEFLNTDTVIFDGRVTDNSLYRVNMTIFTEFDEVVFNNYSGDLSQTIYIWNHTLNFSGNPDANYTVYLEATDQEMIADLGGLNPTTLEFTFYYDECVPVWNCSEYERCLPNMSQSCSMAIDENYCSEPLLDYSSVDTQNCTYVSSSGGSAFPTAEGIAGVIESIDIENVAFSLVGSKFTTGFDFFDKIIEKIKAFDSNWNSDYFEAKGIKPDYGQEQIKKTYEKILQKYSEIEEGIKDVLE